jgi:FkbM family methyltransferase
VASVAAARVLRKPLEIVVNSCATRHPVHLRLRTSDVSVFEEIILNGEYSFAPPTAPRVIVDAGANIGLTSVYFANRFPHAKIIALEPEQANFRMLRKNARYYENIHPVEAALWKENTSLSLSDPGAGSWGFQTHERTDQNAASPLVDAVTLDRLMHLHQCEHIDVLKIDIEGSEKEIFESCEPWIGKVGMIMVELHDRYKSGCSRSVYAATRDFDVEWCRGETTFFARREYAPAALSNPMGSAGGALASRNGASGSLPRARILAVVS